ncbi:MAG: hypothetical protein IJ828_11995 [Treponema sp.]|nr:hypothetical protein [Treponema sp.]
MKLKTAFAVLFMTCTLYSVLYISHESHHECSGEDCPVCLVIAISMQNMKLSGIALVVSAILFSYAFKGNCFFSSIYLSIFTCETLISKKIRLND